MATFDQNISSNFSLARILDELFYSGTEPASIIAFLNMYDDDVLKDMVVNSDCISRVFQLDFLLALDDANQKWILDKLTKVPMRLAAHLAWQVCASNSSVADRLKYKFRNVFKWVLKSAPLRHPYSKTSAQDSRPFDEVLFHAAKRNEIALAATGFKDMHFVNFIQFCPSSSLFTERMFQEDFFRNLNIVNEYAMVKAMSLVDFNIAYNFTRQILNQDFDVAVKRTVIGQYQNLFVSNPNYHNYLALTAFKDNDEIARNYKHSTGFASLYLSMAAMGEDSNSHLAMLMLADSKWDALKEWIEFDRDSLLNAIDLEDVIEDYMSNNV